MGQTQSTQITQYLFQYLKHMSMEIWRTSSLPMLDNQTAASIAENLGYEVNYAPTLTLVPESAQQQGYEFVDGVNGIGAFGFQIPIATALPGDKGYSPIVT